MSAPRKQIGDITATTLSDGVLAAPLDVVLGVERAEIERLAGRKPGEPLPIAVNAFLLERAGKWALVDTGSGNSMGPTLGKLPQISRLGVTPERIETIFLTLLHPDHSNGLVDDAGNAIYPNAEVVLHETEAAFWLDRDEASGATERIRRNIAKTKVTTTRLRARIRIVRDGEAVPGISALLLAGHTRDIPAGSSIRQGQPADLGRPRSSRGDPFARPDTGLVYDVDPQAACATPAHVRPRRRRQARRLRAPTSISPASHHRAQGIGLRL